MSRFTLIFAVIAAVPGLAMLPAVAADLVALVEDVSGAPAGVEPMDYLVAGKEIRLGAKDGVVIDYLRSCWRETISGGTVVIGSEQSVVTGGAVSREKVECDGGKMRLTADQAAKSGVVVFRTPPKPDAHPAVQQTIYGVSPLIDVGGAGKLRLERLDRPGERIDLEITAAQLLHGAFYDFAKERRALAAGGVYRASSGSRSIVFQVDAAAKPGATPPAGRLLKL